MNCHQCNEFLEDYLAGRLPLWRRRAFRRHLAACSTCQSNVRANQIIHQSLGRLGRQTCPDAVIARVFDLLHIETGQTTITAVVFRWPRTGYRYRLRWALVMVVILGTMILFLPERKFHAPKAKHYSAAEIQQAKDQIKFAISWFGQFRLQTQQVLEKKILPDQIIAPLRSTLNTALKPLLVGDNQ